MEEAQKKGACRRIPGVPSGIVVGSSKVFVISDMDTETRIKHMAEFKRLERIRYILAREFDSRRTGIAPKINAKWPRSNPLIFGYFTVKSIIYVTAPGEDVPKRLQELGITKYEYQEGKFGFNDERECGSLKIGGLYVLSEEDMEKVKGLAESSEISGNVFPFKNPIPYSGNRFRGFQSVTQEVGEGLVRRGLARYG